MPIGSPAASSHSGKLLTNGQLFARKSAILRPYFSQGDSSSIGRHALKGTITADQLEAIQRLAASADEAAARSDLGAAINTYSEVVDGLRAAAASGDAFAMLGVVNACAALGELLEQAGDRASVGALVAASPHIDNPAQ